MDAPQSEREKLAQKVRDIVIEHNGYLREAIGNNRASALANEIDRAIADLILVEKAEAKIEGMEQAKRRVLRRTEIPKDAKNPTRDFVVILGEEIADIIAQDVAALTPKTTKEES